MEPGDTAYIGFNVVLKKGNASTLTFSCDTRDSNLKAFISQDKGVPPLYLTVMLVANDTASPAGDRVQITARAGEESVYGTSINAYINPATPVDTNCIAGLLGSYHLDSLQTQIDMTVTPAGGNAIFLNNIDGTGGVAKANVSCTDLKFGIPFQRIHNNLFIEGYGQFNAFQGLNYTLIDSSGNISFHSYSIVP